MIFQVSGLPRSGSAWIATALNFAPDIMAVHEGKDRTVPIPSSSYVHTGQVGSHLLVDNLRDADVDMRIYIDRDSDTCYKQTSKLFGDMFSLDVWNKEVRDRGRQYKQIADIAISFDNLFDVECMKYLWESISEYPFAEDKIAALIGMNIQRNSYQFDIDKELVEYIQKEI